MATAAHTHRRPLPSALLSLTHPNRELFSRQHALLRDTIRGNTQAIDEHLIAHRSTTFFMRVGGNSMHGLGIYDGDLLVVDRAAPATDGAVVIAVLDGEFIVRQLKHTGNGIVLCAAHPAHADKSVSSADFFIWGVVRWNVHKSTHTA